MCVYIVLIVYFIDRISDVREDALTRAETNDDGGMAYGSRIFVMFASFNASLCLIASLLTVYVAPNSAGSGIPEVKAYLNGCRIPNVFNMSNFLVKTLGTILSVSSGLCVGPEGPLVHLGAMIGAALTRSGWAGHQVSHAASDALSKAAAGGNCSELSARFRCGETRTKSGSKCAKSARAA